jgi:hypothetical protein
MTKLASLLVAGDCGRVHGPADGFPIEGYTEFARPSLESADFRFINCMRAYSARGVKTEHAPQGLAPKQCSIRGPY